MFYLNDDGVEFTTHVFEESRVITNCYTFLSKVQENNANKDYYGSAVRALD
jgi:hypothetical protein